MIDSITLNDICIAQNDISNVAINTPLIQSSYFSEKFNTPIFLKLETTQKTGSFKFRGAFHAICQLKDKSKGVVCVSTGNYGLALATAAKLLNCQVTICVSSLVPDNKVNALKKSGAKLIISGKSQDEAQLRVNEEVKQGAIEIPPFDHPHIIAGQGTIGLEILQKNPNINTILVPLSGGGLLAGIAIAAKAIKPSIKVIGISMENGAAMVESLKAQKPVEVKEYPSLADSLGGGIGLFNQYTFHYTKQLVDEVITVSEPQIYDAIQELYQHEGIVCEGASAVGIAALNAGYAVTGETALIISGKNINMQLHQKIINNQPIQLGDTIITGTCV